MGLRSFLKNACETRSRSTSGCLAGGTGQQLNLDEVKAFFDRDPGVKVIFAGGLNPENVNRILDSLGPYRANIAGVDVSSGVESEGKAGSFQNCRVRQGCQR